LVSRGISSCRAPKLWFDLTLSINSPRLTLYFAHLAFAALLNFAFTSADTGPRFLDAGHP
jgi:hypothetical protein